jgi:hypothetical protein
MGGIMQTITYLDHGQVAARIFKDVFGVYDVSIYYDDGRELHTTTTNSGAATDFVDRELNLQYDTLRTESI